MNANNIYTELVNQNDRLLAIKSRLRKTVARICDDAPPRSGPVAGPGLVKQESTFLSEVESISAANADIISDISNELSWLESTFDTNDTPAFPSADSARAFR
jgi:hypothetical protein